MAHTRETTRNSERRHCVRPVLRSSLAVIFAAAACLPAGQSQAATATATMGVSALVVATCIIAATPMAFGTYTGAVSNSAATLTVICTTSAPFTVGLNAGTGTSPTATVTSRHMTGPSSASLNYTLSQDAAHSINWGNTPGTDTPASSLGTGLAQILTVYGQIPASQYVATGSYSDTITATINF